MKTRKEVYLTLLIALVWALSLTPVFMGIVQLVSPLDLSQGGRRALAMLLRLALYGNLTFMALWVAKRLGAVREISLAWQGAGRGLLVGLAAGTIPLLFDWINGKAVLELSPQKIAHPGDFFDLLFFPWMESALCCGAAYTALRRHHHPILAAIISALFFTSLHFGNTYGAWDQSWHYFLGYCHGMLPAYLVSGLVFSGVYAATESLSAPIAAHFLVNLFAAMR